MQGCASTYCQLYTVGADSKIFKTKDALVFNDTNCEIMYNLWNESGSMDFIFTNKTENDIYIDLTRSFFIQNGMAYDYYSDIEYTSTRHVSKATSVSASLMASYNKYRYAQLSHIWAPTLMHSGANINSTTNFGYSNSVTTKSDKYVYIPAKSSKVVKGFSISNYVYLVCENNDFNCPKNESETFTYKKGNSPFKFRNRIAYVIGGETRYIDNEFWITSVKNYKAKHLISTKKEKDCITKEEKEKQIFKISGADMFYNTYKKVFGNFLLK